MSANWEYEMATPPPTAAPVPCVYLPTKPGIMLELTAARPWCAGHPWRWHRGLGWLHQLGHRARVLRAKKQPMP